jgi:hypothetical protein
MAKIITNVKDVDDFGKKQLNENTYEYSQHFPRVIENDILIYYYPKINALGIYQATKELEYYYKDGFQYCRGLMIKYQGSGEQFIELIKSRDIETGNMIEKTIYDLVSKHKIENNLEIAR